MAETLPEKKHTVPFVSEIFGNVPSIEPILTTDLKKFGKAQFPTKIAAQHGGDTAMTFEQIREAAYMQYAYVANEIDLQVTRLQQEEYERSAKRSSFNSECENLWSATATPMRATEQI